MEKVEKRGVKKGSKRGAYNITKTKPESEKRSKNFNMKFTEDELNEVKLALDTYKGKSYSDKLLTMIRER